ncbi:MAG: sensor histidine kinase [Acidimicrobiales bacterium]
MALRHPLDLVRNLKRPALRVQLTILYSCLFLGVLAAVLLATNVLYGHTAARAPNGVTTAAPVSGSQTFDFGPALLGLAAAVVALAGAWWLAGRFLRPLHAITATAQEISATNLNRRLALTGPNDELTALGRTLDDLFGRLESSFEAQRHFVANASHELRTPLAGQRTLLQVALADPDADTASLRAACEEALQLGDQQEHLIDALLTLATSERDIERWATFDLADVAQNIVAGRRHEAERLGLRIDATLVAAPAVGDSRLIELLVANLVDNALRHNHPGGQIEISTISPPGRATITVANTGPTVSADQVERLFQPFQQTGSPRVHHSDGHGLGLAIVAAIARTHHAKVNATPRPQGGLEVNVTFESHQRPA